MEHYGRNALCQAQKVALMFRDLVMKTLIWRALAWSECNDIGQNLSAKHVQLELQVPQCREAAEKLWQVPGAGQERPLDGSPLLCVSGYNWPCNEGQWLHC
eukprot:1036365-Pelagomonas_calceolata.AAC.1